MVSAILLTLQLLTMYSAVNGTVATTAALMVTTIGVEYSYQREERK